VSLALRIIALGVLVGTSGCITTEPFRRESLGQQVGSSRQPDGTVAALWRNQNRFALTLRDFSPV
jgi:hypothetical protein